MADTDCISCHLNVIAPNKYRPGCVVEHACAKWAWLKCPKKVVLIFASTASVNSLDQADCLNMNS